MKTVKPDSSTLTMIELKTAEEGYEVEFKCTECDWRGLKVAARKDKDGLVETYCPECLAEADYIYNN